jgi:hypothetical protein
VSASYKADGRDIHGPDGLIVAIAQTPEYGERIATCLNACAGLPNEALKAVARTDYTALPLKLAAVMGQRDELALVLKLVVEICGDVPGNAVDSGLATQLYRIASAAFAKPGCEEDENR